MFHSVRSKSRFNGFHRALAVSSIIGLVGMELGGAVGWASPVLAERENSPSGSATVANGLAGYDSVSYETFEFDQTLFDREPDVFMSRLKSFASSLVDKGMDLYEAAKSLSDKLEGLASGESEKEFTSLSDDPYYKSKTISSAYDDLWWHKTVHAEEAWKLSTGRGVTVAVVDTGVDLGHEDLYNKAFINSGEVDGNGIDDDGNGFVDDVSGWDFANRDNLAKDDHGHGTHVAGIIGALANNQKGIAGIASDSKILAVKVLNSQGSGTFAQVAEGVRYAAMMGAQVINMSLGAAFTMALNVIKSLYPDFYQTYIAPFQQAVQFARSKGAVVIVAAGNSNIDVARTMPGGFEEVISVAATTASDGRASFSNWGSGLDFSAPGVDILSLRASGTSMGTAAGLSYTRASGTSMAAPIVSGVAALLLAQDSSLGQEGVYRRLKFSSQDLGTAGFDTSFGYGRVDAFKALSFDYFDDGRVKTHYLAEPDSSGAVRLGYDTLGRLVQKTFKDGSRMVLTYHNGTTARASESLYASDGAWVQTTQFAVDGVTVIKVESADGVSRSYDEKGRLVKEVRRDGSTHEFFVSGNKKRVTFADGSVSEYLDENWKGRGYGRLSRQVLADGTEVRYSRYTASSEQARSVIQIRNGVTVSDATYDSLGRKTLEKLFRANGALSSVRQYTAGILRSETLYHENGQIVSDRLEYDNKGTLRRLEKFSSRGVLWVRKAFGSDSHIQSEERFREDGTRIFSDFYDANSVLRRRDEFDAKGVLSLRKRFGADSKLQSIENFREDGSLLTRDAYDAEGALRRHEAFGSNGLISLRRLFDAKSRVTDEVAFFDHGVRQTHKAFDVNGTLRRLDTYDRSGKLVSRELWNANGSKSQLQTFWENGRVKTAETYYPNGKMKSSQNFLADGKQGMLVEWYDTGKLKSRVIRGSDGSLKFREQFDANGILRQRDEFDGGKLAQRLVFDAKGKLSGQYEYNSSGYLKLFQSYSPNGSVLLTKRY